MTIQDVLAVLDEIAPPSLAFSFDRIGLQVGDPFCDVKGVMVTLDCTTGCIDNCISKGLNLVISHHPIIWEPLKSLRTDSVVGRILTKMVTSGTGMIAAHTNWDVAEGGVNDALTKKLGLVNIQRFGSSPDQEWFKLVVFVPREHADRLLDALAEAGSGRIGHYARCGFVSEGQGTFLPIEGSDPAIGQRNRIENVAESKLETVVPSSHLPAAIRALRATHPYEVPAFDIIPLKQPVQAPIGRAGDLPHSLSPDEFSEYVETRLGTKASLWGPSSKIVKRVAVIGGAASDEWEFALKCRADAFVTGEVKHADGVAAAESGLVMVQAGHYETEQPGVEALADILRNKLAPVPVLCHNPSTWI